MTSAELACSGDATDSAQSVASPPQSSILFKIPYEILETILCYCTNLDSLRKTCKLLNEIVGQNPSFRAVWLAAKFTRKYALMGCLAYHSKLIQSTDVGLETLKILLNFDVPVPRYVIQKTFKKMISLNSPLHITETLNFGMKHYTDLGLNERFDDQELFCQILNNLLGTSRWQVINNTEEEEAKRVKAYENIGTLVKEHKFSVNFGCFNFYALKPRHVERSGEALFKTALRTGHVDVVEMFLNHGIQTYSPHKVPYVAPPIEQVHAYLQSDQHHGDGSRYSSLNPLKFISRNYWKRSNSWKGASIHRYVPLSEDLIVTAIASKRIEIVKALLEATPDRWKTSWGQCVLCSCIQYSVDIRWSEGKEVLATYFTALPGAEFKRSRFQLNYDLESAIFSHDEFQITQLLQKGAAFTPDDPGKSYNIGALFYLVCMKKKSLLSTIFELYTCPPTMVVQLLHACIKRDRHDEMARFILDKQPDSFDPPSQLMALFITSRRPELLEWAINRRKSIAPSKKDPMLKTWIRMAQRRHEMRAVQLLQSWEASIVNANENGKKRKFKEMTRGTKNKKGKKKVTEVSSDESDDDDEFSEFEEDVKLEDLEVFGTRAYELRGRKGKSRTYREESSGQSDNEEEDLDEVTLVGELSEDSEHESFRQMSGFEADVYLDDDSPHNKATSSSAASSSSSSSSTTRVTRSQASSRTNVSSSSALKTRSSARNKTTATSSSSTNPTKSTQTSSNRKSSASKTSPSSGTMNHSTTRSNKKRRLRK